MTNIVLLLKFNSDWQTNIHCSELSSRKNSRFLTHVNDRVLWLSEKSKISINSTFELYRNLATIFAFSKNNWNLDMSTVDMNVNERSGRLSLTDNPVAIVATRETNRISLRL